MGIIAKDVIDLIIRPALTGIGLYSEGAVQLLAGTCAQESGMGKYLKQTAGPALGAFQIEPKTHYDIHSNYLRYHADLASLIYKVSGMEWHNIGTIPWDDHLTYNLRYAACIARIIYYRSSKAIPAFDDIKSQAEYWKSIYNTIAGKGDCAAYLTNYTKYVKLYYT